MTTADLLERIEELEATIDSLFDAIKHGDQEHQDWLLAAINEHFKNVR